MQFGSRLAALAAPFMAQEASPWPEPSKPTVLPRPDFRLLARSAGQSNIGMDVGSAVDFTYEPPFAYTGEIKNVTVALE